DVFETTYFDFETLSSRFREYAFLNKGLTIVLRDERPEGTDEGADDDVESEVTADQPREAVYQYDDGLVDYVKHLNTTKTAIHPSILEIGAESEDDDGQAMSLELAMQWNEGYTASVHSFANTINTHEGGTHEE